MKLRALFGAAGAVLGFPQTKEEPAKQKFQGKQLRIAIIGGGIAGTATAHFLHKQCNNKINVDLFERNEIGGRLSTVSIANREFETGGSIIHDKNKYMKTFLKEFDLKKREESDDGRLGLWNGKQFTFSGADSDLWTAVKLLFSYGFDVFRLRQWLNSMLNDFCKIYDIQKNGVCFDDVESLISAMSPNFLPEMRSISLKEKLISQGYHEKFIDQLAAAACRANYGQLVNLPAFVGYVSLCGAMDGLWAVQGGNKLIPQKLLENSCANLIKCDVTSITRDLETGLYSVKYRNPEIIDVQVKEYDVVVLALPFDNMKQNVVFRGIKQFPQPGNYERIVSTLVQGIPNYESYFGKHKKRCPNDIISINPHTFWNTFSNQTPIDFKCKEKNDTNVWKIFSSKPLEKNEITCLFERVDEVQIIDWQAYPKYNIDIPSDLSFKLDSGLFYTNCIEFAASCMEMSCIAAKNVALLIDKQYFP